MANAKAKVSTSLVMVADTKALGETVDTLGSGYVLGRTVGVTKGKDKHVHVL